MTKREWDFEGFFTRTFGPEAWGFGPPRGRGRGWGPGRRGGMFESGEVKYVILTLLREKPRHGYDIIKALEERLGGCYTPSAGTVYPTLQLLEDQGLIRGVEEGGKRVYHITPEGEAFLQQNRTVVDEIFERVRDTVRDVAGGPMGELHGAFARLAGATYKQAWRMGPGHPAIPRIVEIVNRATADIEQVWRETTAERR